MPARLARMTWFIASAAFVLMLLGFAYAVGLYGDSRWTGIFLLFSGGMGSWLAIDAYRLKRRIERASIPDSAQRSSEARDFPGRRAYPLMVGTTFFLIGVLAGDIVVGILSGLAGLAFGWLATVPIAPRRRRKESSPSDEGD